MSYVLKIFKLSGLLLPFVLLFVSYNNLAPIEAGNAKTFNPAKAKDNEKFKQNIPQKPNHVITLNIVPSENTYDDPNKVIVLDGRILSKRAFDQLSVQWKLEGNVELVAGNLESSMANVEANQEYSNQISVRFTNKDDFKVVFFVYHDEDKSRIGQTAVLSPPSKPSIAIESLPAQSFKLNKAKKSKIMY